MGSERTSWRLSENDTRLTLTGQGLQEDYPAPGAAPWHEHAGAIRCLTVEPGAVSLGVYALAGCTALEEAELPEGLRYVGAKAFSGCSRLKTVYLPASLETVELKAFRGCEALTDVYYAGTEAQWRSVRISPASRGNRPLLNARLHCLGGPGAADDASRPDHRAEIIRTLRGVLAQGGDGRLHILAPSLTVPDCPGKTGDCTLLVFPAGRTMLIDAGLSLSREHVLSMLMDLGLKRLDAFLLSHPHPDHIGNALDVAEYCAIGTYYSAAMPPTEAEAELTACLRALGAEIRPPLRTGDRWELDGVTLEVFHPGEDMPEAAGEAVNDCSILLKLTYGESSYLTGGDLYTGMEASLVRRYGPRLRADVMKTNHHGLYTSNSRLWLETVSPRLALTEGDDGGNYTAMETASALGAAWYSTGWDGMVLISLDRRGGLEVRSQYGGHMGKEMP
ncbi:MAG: leucine-rich repeat protein [Oscillospiraceae bacterium]|nr:leucine-rich repeat protein [Oscillospiraceae bacterium]